MQLEKILSRLEGVKKSRDQYMACCPAHADGDPSLGIKEVENKILLHCFAGCSVIDVLDAIGLTISDVYKDGPEYHRGKPIRSSYRLKPAPVKSNQDSYYNTVIAIAKSDLYKGTDMAPVDMNTVQEAKDYFERKKKMNEAKKDSLPTKLSDYRHMKRSGIKLTEEQVAHERQLMMERYR